MLYHHTYNQQAIPNARDLHVTETPPPSYPEPITPLHMESGLRMIRYYGVDIPVKCKAIPLPRGCNWLTILYKIWVKTASVIPESHGERIDILVKSL